MPKSTLTLRRAIWNAEVRRSIMNKALNIAAQDLEQALKDNINDSTPAGRLYKRRPPGSSGGRGSRRAIVQSIEVIASEQGQPPARVFSRLYNSIVAKRVQGKLSIIAMANAPGAAVLDDPDGLNRPYFRSVIQSYRRNQFYDTVRSAIRELTQ